MTGDDAWNREHLQPLAEDVLALTEDHAAHRDTCPLRTTTSEGRAAA